MLFSAIRTVSSPKLRFSTPRLVYAVPLAIIAVLFHNSSPRLFALPALYLSAHLCADTLLRLSPHVLRFSCPLQAVAILDISYPFRCLNFSFPGPHFSVLRYPPTPKCNSFPSPRYQASRLSRSCCSRVSDSLAVCSSHRGNPRIRC